MRTRFVSITVCAERAKEFTLSMSMRPLRRKFLLALPAPSSRRALKGVMTSSGSLVLSRCDWATVTCECTTRVTRRGQGFSSSGGVSRQPIATTAEKLGRNSPGNPILKVGKARWESGAIGFCSVFKEGPLWKMWYLGTTEDAIKQVGYATSKDGLKWDRHPGNPVIAVNPDNRWEKGAIAVPRVIRQGKLYKVWYCCYEKNNTYAIGCAESVDGIDWRRSPHNPVRLPEGKGFASSMVAYPGVVNIGDRYMMWYSGNGYGNAGLGLATAITPTGKVLFRTGTSRLPDDSWSVWQRLSDVNQEPKREGNIQFAVVMTKK